MLIRIDPSSDRPLSDQVASCVRRALADGEVRAGERLPSARDVAKSLGINMHTVLRGYQTLKGERLLELRPGRGAVVTSEEPRGRARMLGAARELVEAARALGLSDEEILTTVTGTLATPPPESPHEPPHEGADTR